MDKSFLQHTYKVVRRIVIAVVGMTIILFGIALIFLPGPAFIVIPTGLGILSLEFAWARRWIKKARYESEKTIKTFWRRHKRKDTKNKESHLNGQD